MDTKEELIEVETLWGRSMKLEFAKGDNIMAIKTRIHDAEGIPVEKQNILREGNKLSDEYVPNQHDHLVLSVNMKGGGAIMEIKANDFGCGSCSGPPVTYEEYGATFEKDAFENGEMEPYTAYKFCIGDCCGYRGKMCDMFGECVMMFVCFCWYPCCCLYGCCVQYDSNAKEAIIKNNTARIEKDGQFLDERIIDNWYEYERMFSNVLWKGHITKQDFLYGDNAIIKGANEINTITTPRHYAMVTTIFENTDNTPSRIRNKKQLIEVLNEKEQFEYLLFVLLKCEPVDVYKWLQSMGLEQYYDNMVSNGYVDMGIVLSIQSKNTLLSIGIRDRFNQRILLENIRSLRQNQNYAYQQWNEDTAQLVCDMEHLFTGKQCEDGWSYLLETKCSICNGRRKECRTSWQIVQDKIVNEDDKKSGSSLDQPLL